MTNSRKILKLSKLTKSAKTSYVEKEEVVAFKKDKEGNLANHGFRATAFRLAQQQILVGKTKQEIVAQFRDLRSDMKLPPSKPNYLDHIYDAAHKNLTRDLKEERESVIRLHINRYNADVERLYNVDISNVNRFKGIEIKTQAYLDLLDVLKQKEKLLGFHRREMKIKINNTINASIKKTGELGSFNLSELTMEEKIELIRLIDKAKLSDEDLFFNSLQEGGDKGYIDEPDNGLIEDIEYEDVTESKDEEEDTRPLVSRIKQPTPITSSELKPQSADEVKAKLMAALMRVNIDEGKNQKI